MLALVTQKKPEDESPSAEDLYARGTAGRILKMLKYPDASVRILVQGLRRIEFVEYTQTEPHFRARIRQLDDAYGGEQNLDAMQAHMVNQFGKFVSMIPYLPDELQVVAMNIKDAGKVTDLIASNLNISIEEKQELLSTLEVRKRLEQLSTILNREIELLELGSKIQSQVQDELSKSQKDFYLRQQMRAIQKELGEGDSRESEIGDLLQKLQEANPPEEARKAAEQEIERLRMIPVESAEHTVVRTYLEWIVNLPWSASTEDNLDIPHARKVLDEDHYDLEKIKDRILEFLAVRKLKKDSKGPILCFVGPPGIGKTSLGRSIARAMGRKFMRISLGGMRDEAEIRGHRRTYIGSLPGRIIQSLRTAGSNNPVFMLDEIDKLGADFRGDPASALLEVLDPEQNNSFQDHYLDVPFDLSKVMFITTANLLDPIPPPLRDRMEVIGLAGYTDEEKLHIARQHLIPKQTDGERHRGGERGVHRRGPPLPDPPVHARGRTAEPGARDRQHLPQGRAPHHRGEDREGDRRLPRRSASCSAPERFFAEVAERTGEPGVATGLVWTPMGGDIIFIEATKMTGTQGPHPHRPARRRDEGIGAGRAQPHPLARRPPRHPARTSSRSQDIHIHVPAGAVPKDGPSAGVTIATALASLLTRRPVRHDVAMTGEITLRGKVLPVGGIKEKVSARAAPASRSSSCRAATRRTSRRFRKRSGVR